MISSRGIAARQREKWIHSFRLSNSPLGKLQRTESAKNSAQNLFWKIFSQVKFWKKTVDHEQVLLLCLDSEEFTTEL